MITGKLRHFPIAMVAMVLVAGVGGWLLATQRAGALDDTTQMLTGGRTMVAGELLTAPGHTLAFTPEQFNNQGEAFVQMIMPAGTLSRLKVKVTTQDPPSSGSFTMTVRVDGADTNLTCTLNGPGTCTSRRRSKAISNNSLLSVAVVSDFVDANIIAFTYTMQFD